MKIERNFECSRLSIPLHFLIGNFEKNANSGAELKSWTSFWIQFQNSSLDVSSNIGRYFPFIPFASFILSSFLSNFTARRSHLPHSSIRHNQSQVIDKESRLKFELLSDNHNNVTEIWKKYLKMKTVFIIDFVQIQVVHN